MNAIILADGQRSCLQSLTENKPRSIAGRNSFSEHRMLGSLPRPLILGSRGLGGPSVLSITSKNVVSLGRAFSGFLGYGKRVVTARDGPSYSSLFKPPFISGLLTVSLSANDLEQSSLPETRFITNFNRYGDGVIEGLCHYGFWPSSVNN